MAFWPAFGVGVLGAFAVYLARFRGERLANFLHDTKNNWPVLVFDLFIFLFLGGILVAFLGNPANPKEAFLGGGTWEGLITNIPTKPKEGGS